MLRYVFADELPGFPLPSTNVGCEQQSIALSRIGISPGGKGNDFDSSLLVWSTYDRSLTSQQLGPRQSYLPALRRKARHDQSAEGGKGGGVPQRDLVPN